MAKSKKIRDPGFCWFKDYYDRFESAEQVANSLRLGQLIAVPFDDDHLRIHSQFFKSKNIRCIGQQFVVLSVENGLVCARNTVGPLFDISFEFHNLVAPDNPLFALSHYRGKEESLLNQVLALGGS